MSWMVQVAARAAAAAACAISTSCATAPPETPTAPMQRRRPRSAAECRRRTATRPPLVSSRPGAGAPGLQYSQTASLLAWNRTAVRALLEGDVDRAEHRAVHAAEGLQMRAGVEDGDDDRHAELESLGRRAVDDRLRLVRGDLHDVAPVRVC